MLSVSTETISPSLRTQSVGLPYSRHCRKRYYTYRWRQSDLGHGTTHRQQYRHTLPHCRRPGCLLRPWLRKESFLDEPYDRRSYQYCKKSPAEEKINNNPRTFVLGFKLVNILILIGLQSPKRCQRQAKRARSVREYMRVRFCAVSQNALRSKPSHPSSVKNQRFCHLPPRGRGGFKAGTLYRLAF